MPLKVSKASAIHLTVTYWDCDPMLTPVVRSPYAPYAPRLTRLVREGGSQTPPALNDGAG